MFKNKAVAVNPAGLLLHGFFSEFDDSSVKKRFLSCVLQRVNGLWTQFTVW
jgi:hypothetical protein